MYLDYAENQASRQIPMRMADWVAKLDAFLQFNEYEVLNNAGKVSHEVAKQLAETEYDAFRVAQDRDYDRRLRARGAAADAGTRRASEAVTVGAPQTTRTGSSRATPQCATRSPACSRRAGCAGGAGGAARHHDGGPGAAILAEQQADGHWEGPDRFYTAKYRGTVWTLLILAELGADGADERVQAGCEAVLRDAQDPQSGGFSHKRGKKAGGGLHSLRHPLPHRQPRLQPRPLGHARRPARAAGHRLDHHLPALRRRRGRGAHRLALR